MPAGVGTVVEAPTVVSANAALFDCPLIYGNPFSVTDMIFLSAIPFNAVLVVECVDTSILFVVNRE